NGVTARIKTSDGKSAEHKFTHVIVAVGIAPNSENIGLEPLGVKTTKGHVDTDPYGRTNASGIWAIGDVTAPPWLAHKAMHAAVTELIQGYTIGKTAELIDEDLIQTVFPHPTLSEMMHEAVLAADGRVLHI